MIMHELGIGGKEGRTGLGEKGLKDLIDLKDEWDIGDEYHDEMPMRGTRIGRWHNIGSHGKRALSHGCHYIILVAL